MEGGHNSANRSFSIQSKSVLIGGEFVCNVGMNIELNSHEHVIEFRNGLAVFLGHNLWKDEKYGCQ